MEYLKGLEAIFQGSLSNVWGLFAAFVPIFFLAVAVFIIGMFIASVVGKAIAQVITVTKVDKLFESAGAGEFFSKMGVKLSVGNFFGVIIKWFIAFVFLMVSLEILHLSDVSQFIGQMILIYLPKVIIVAIVLVLATIIADAVKKIVLASSKAANIASAETLASISKYGVWVVVFVLIYPYLGLDNVMMQILFGGIIGTITIAAGLAFGLGGKEAAARAIEKVSKEMSGK